ncbi:hypothetical protein ACFO3I_10720 [Rheinheimera marina]|uniref:Uncharacterized protein n=1 Tax=Rheinheimera marina TaxID=1774958 RepID=A0ABV9JMT5_9GAMM
MLILTVWLLGLFLLPVASVGVISLLWHWLSHPLKLPSVTRS